MKLDKVIDILKKHKPTTQAQLKSKKLDLDLKYLDSGAFRKVYKIRGAKAVIKLPINQSGRDHSQAEHEEICKILGSKKYTLLQKYMPSIYYYDVETKLIVMQEYEVVGYKFTNKTRNNMVISSLMYDLFKSVFPYAKKGNSIDLFGNIGYYKDKITGSHHPVVIDLGYFSDFGKGWNDY